jgi:hypothetical protein
VKRTTKAVLIVAGAAVVIAAGIVLWLRFAKPHRRPTPPQGELYAVTPEPPPVRHPIQFTGSDVPGRIVEALEYVVGKGHAQAAVWPLRKPRCFCVMVNGAQRCYELEQGMRAADFEGLADGGFRPLPPEMSRTTSIYRAVAKQAVPVFDETVDRILIVLCPKDDWPKVSLRWPPVPADAK